MNMEIGLLISGNLTGFSSFYATNEAKEILKSTKFNFDFHNWITFLRDGDELHAVSFSSNYIAVSLVTNILDSFRRPGNLVVSIMMPRYCDIMETSNPDNKSALYTLLHEINDKFYEKNFFNEMVSQNPSALMQDYYTEILSRYSLFTDRKQKCVNVNIDPSSPNKKVGYVASADRDIPNYLSSINRKSYEGFHYVFFAPNAPQNIDEPPVEAVLYRVYITNNRMTLPAAVKLTDFIYPLEPERWEVPFDQHYTYEEVLQGKAGSRVQASLEGEMLRLTYSFEEERRRICFEFVENGIPVPLAQVSPVIEYSDGRKFNLPSDTYVFIGKEIYAPKKLISNNPRCVIKEGSRQLDVQRFSDGALCVIQVESATVLDYVFPYPYDDVPKTVTLSRINTGESISLQHVRDRLYCNLPGKLEEWGYRIESDDYETLKGEFPSRLDELNFQFQKKAALPPIAKIPDYPAPVPERERTGSFLISTRETDAPSKPKVDDLGQRNRTKNVSRPPVPKRTLNMKKVFLVAFPVILLVAGAIFYFNPDKTDDDNVADTETSVIDTVFVNVKLMDKNENYLDNNDDYKDKKAVVPYVDVKVKESGEIQKNSRTTNDSLSYEFIAAKDCEDDISFEVHFGKNILCEKKVAFKDLGNEVILKLSASIQAINLYKDLSNIIDNKIPVNQSKLGELEKSFNECYKNSTDTDVLRDSLEAMLERVKPVTLRYSVQKTPTNTTGDDLIRNKLNRVSLTLKDLEKIEPNNDNEKERIKALKEVLESFENKKIPSDNLLDKLSNDFRVVSSGYRLSQRQILEDLIETSKKIKKNDDRNKLLKGLGKSASLYQSFNVVLSLNDTLAYTRKNNQIQ